MFTDNSIKDAPFKFDAKVWKFPLYFVVVLWLLFGLNFIFNLQYEQYGIFPRNIQGLRGIVFSPFIHGNLDHLYSNSVPVFVLMAVLIYFYRPIAAQVLIYGTFLTGIFTWFIARGDSFHIGASGVIYLLASFIFFSGIIRKSLRLVAISLVVAFLYGGMIWYVFPIVEGMSWEGHLSGFLSGILLAYHYKDKGLVKKEYTFTPSEIDNFIDENGNFVPPPPSDESSNHTTLP